MAVDRCMRERISAADGPTERVVSLESCIDISGELLIDADKHFDIQYSVVTRETSSFRHLLVMRAPRAAPLARKSDQMVYAHQLPYHREMCKPSATLGLHAILDRNGDEDDVNSSATRATNARPFRECSGESRYLSAVDSRASIIP